MAQHIELVSYEDLLAIKKEIITELKTILDGNNVNNKKWVRAKQARELLGGISCGSLTNLRIKGLIKFSRISGVYYYSVDDINAKLNQNGGVES